MRPALPLWRDSSVGCSTPDKPGLGHGLRKTEGQATNIKKDNLSFLEEKMKKIKWVFFIVLPAMFIPFSVMAGDFDGSGTLLFASQEVHECSAKKGCKEREAADINLPSFFIINFEKKTITAPPESERKDVTKIKRIENKDGVLYVQGAEDGYEGAEDGVGWTLAIEEDSGKGVLTGSMPGAAIVVFGVCTPR